MPIVVLVTTPPDRAHDLARTLVDERLAACVNVMPVLQSIYRWQGEVAEDAEALLIIKTRQEHYDALQRRIVELHPYDIPEVISLDIQGGLPAYLGWLTDNVRSPD